MDNAQLIGEGTFGKVFRVKDSEAKIWAVKLMKVQEEDEGIPATALREITILKNLKSHPNIIQMGKIDFSRAGGKSEIKIYFKFCEKDLKRYIREQEEAISIPAIKRILSEILSGVAYMHRKGIIHRDIKPQNILLDQKGTVQIADFGLARILLPTQKTLTREVQTLYYRAPEVMLGKRKYNQSVDIWAVGCIMAQLFLKRPLFLGGYTQIQQIFKVFQIMGTPKKQEWPQFVDLEDSTPKFPKWFKQPLGGIIKNIPEQGLDLLQQMLEYDPVKRISAENALKHAFFCL